MNTPIAEEYRQQAEALARKIESIIGSELWCNKLRDLIATSLAEVAETSRADKFEKAFSALCQIKDLGNDEHMSVARALAESALSAFEFDENENLKAN